MQINPLLLKLDIIKNKIFNANKKVLVNLEAQSSEVYFLVENFAKQLEQSILMTYTVFMESENGLLMDDILFIDDIHYAENLANNLTPRIKDNVVDDMSKFNCQQLLVMDIFRALAQRVTEIAQTLNYEDALKKYFAKIVGCIYDILNLLSHVVNVHLDKLFNVNKRG